MIMKLQKQIMIAVGAMTFSSLASATLSFDLRHELKDGNATKSGEIEHASRFKFGDTFKLNDSWGANLSLETKFKSEDATDFMGNMFVNEMELDMGLTYKLGGGWLLKPGMPINIGFETPSKDVAGGSHLYRKKVTYKPQLRVQHTWKESAFKWTNALRYRHEFADYRSNQSGDTAYDKAGNSYKVTNPQTGKVTLTGSLAFKVVKNLYFAWEANYIKSFDNVKKGVEWDDTTDWDAGVFLGYNLGNWRPYVEYWNIKNSGYGSADGNPDPEAKRGNKYRIGLRYAWK